MWRFILKGFFFIGSFLCLVFMSASLSLAQGSGVAVFPEPSILVSTTKATLFESKQNLLSSLVEVRAVDEPALYSDNGQMKMGAVQRKGNGIIIDSSGVIVTNTHIIGDAGHVFVRLSNGLQLEARVVYASEDDFSFLKVNTKNLLKTIVWADSSSVKSGDPVIAIIDQENILGGQIMPLAQGEQVDLIELDVPLQHGDSGGPVLDQHGALLGLIMAKEQSKKNRSYAISSNKIREEYFKFNGSVLIKLK